MAASLLSKPNERIEKEEKEVTSTKMAVRTVNDDEMLASKVQERLYLFYANVGRTQDSIYMAYRPTMLHGLRRRLRVIWHNT